ncbi:hypothetical protein BGW41_007835 [Actinomortierella wolfii]|nr:hypothetical protein BGW41_007835 [Actinomortierella wolfii]
MNAQEKLEAMFCPRLDSALVASIYNDLGDFAECIPILSALAKAAISDDEDNNGYDNVGQQSETRSIAQSSSNSTSMSKNSKRQQQKQQNTKVASSTNNKKNSNNKKGKANSKTSAANQQLSDATSSATTTTTTTTTTTEEQISHHPLKEKILLWTESVAASQSDLAAPAQTKNKPSSSSSSSSTSSTVQYLPSPAPVQPLTAPAGFKGFKASETQVVSHSTLGSTLPSSSSTGTAATTTDTSATTTTTNTPATRLKAVRNPNFVREVTPLEVPSASEDEDEDEDDDEDDEDDGFENRQGTSNSGLVSSSSMASSSGEVKKKKNRRSGRGRKDRKKREALRAEAEAAAVLSAFSALMTEASPSPPPLKSWKKDRGGGRGRGRGQQQQQEMNEVAALLDSASRLSSVQLHRERQRQNGSQGVEEGSSKDGNSQDDNNDDDDDNEDQGAHQAKNGDMDKLDAKRREQVSFLRSCFPDKGHSDEYLIQCLKESRWDIESAVELILSRMFLENEQVETSSSGSNLSRSTTDSYSSWTTVTSTGSKDDVLMYGAKQSGKHGKSSNNNSRASAIASQRILQDTLGSAGHSSDILSNTLAGQDELLLPGPGNDWAAFEHQIQVLMSTFHTIPRKTIVATFHSNGANLIKTIEALEALQRSNGQPWMPLNREAVEASRQFDTKLAQLVEMFPGHAVSGLKKFLVFNEGNVQEAMNAILAAGFADEDLRPSALAMASSSSGSSHQTEYVPLPVDIRYKNDRNGTPIPASLLTEAPGQGGWSKSSLSQLPSTSNPFPQGVRAFPNTLLDHSNAELYNDEDDPVWCRQQASEALQQRNELFRKAAKAYQQSKGKGVGAGGIAAYYADEGKKFDAMGKKWHMRAARAVVQQHRLENNDPNLVDLHGLTISEAQTVVREAVTEWFARSTMQANRIAARPLRIVTGVGSHSKDRIARLYPSILSMLQKDGWRIETENGVILVKGVSRLVTTNRK